MAATIFACKILTQFSILLKHVKYWFNFIVELKLNVLLAAFWDLQIQLLVPPINVYTLKKFKISEKELNVKCKNCQQWSDKKLMTEVNCN